MSLVVGFKHHEGRFFNNRFAFTERNGGYRNDILGNIFGKTFLVAHLDGKLLGKIQSCLLAPAFFLRKVLEIQELRRKLALSGHNHAKIVVVRNRRLFQIHTEWAIGLISKAKSGMGGNIYNSIFRVDLLPDKTKASNTVFT